MSRPGGQTLVVCSDGPTGRVPWGGRGEWGPCSPGAHPLGTAPARGRRRQCPQNLPRGALPGQGSPSQSGSTEPRTVVPQRALGPQAPLSQDSPRAQRLAPEPSPSALEWDPEPSLTSCWLAHHLPVAGGPTSWDVLPGQPPCPCPSGPGVRGQAPSLFRSGLPVGRWRGCSRLCPAHGNCRCPCSGSLSTAPQGSGPSVAAAQEPAGHPAHRHACAAPRTPSGTARGADHRAPQLLAAPASPPGPAQALLALAGPPGEPVPPETGWGCLAAPAAPTRPGSGTFHDTRLCWHRPPPRPSLPTFILPRAGRGHRVFPTAQGPSHGSPSRPIPGSPDPAPKRAEPLHPLPDTAVCFCAGAWGPACPLPALCCPVPLPCPPPLCTEHQGLGAMPPPERPTCHRLPEPQLPCAHKWVRGASLGRSAGSGLCP